MSDQSNKWRKENPERSLRLNRKYDSIRLHKPDRRAYMKKYLAARKARLNFPIVYVWVNPDGRADWVGRGTLQRANYHKYAKSVLWHTPKHILLTMTCDSEWQAMEYEGKWGAFYQPRYNKEGYRHNGQA